jgi:hypothetical protein
VSVASALASAVNAIGSALSSAANWVASLGSGAPPKPPPSGGSGKCFDVRDGLLVPLGSLDVLRAGGLDTDQEFYLYGRSGLMDAQNPARPALPTTPCPK